MVRSPRLRLLLALPAAWLLTGFGHATPAYLETFLNTYAPGGTLKEANCGICHTEVPQHNAYGKTLNAALLKTETMTVDAALLRSIEAADSDGDGMANGDEIRAGTLPGDPKSVPAVKASPAPVAPRATALATKGQSPLPRHAFHPSLVHFPLALFLFGGVLDLVGLARRRSNVRLAGVWNMTAGTIATALTIPTGFVAASLSGYALTWGSGVMSHLLFALGSTVLMTGLVTWRARGERRGAAYVGLLLVTITLLAWAGHLGGGLVYGG